MADRFVVHTDGGARGNPGPAGIGVVIERESEKGKERLAHISEYVGETTNNQAEYRALIAGLEYLVAHGGQGSQVACLLDSELIVEQLSGRYRVKHAELRPLVARVEELVRVLGGAVTFAAIPRSANRRADNLVNQAIDTHQSTIAHRQ
jgi:ribonuclease HI